MSKLGKEGYNGHLEFVLNDNKTKLNSDLLHLKKEKRKRAEGI